MCHAARECNFLGLILGFIIFFREFYSMSLKEKFEKIKRSITGEPQDDEGGMVAEVKA